MDYIINHMRYFYVNYVDLISIVQTIYIKNIWIICFIILKHMDHTLDHMHLYVLLF